MKKSQLTALLVLVLTASLLSSFEPQPTRAAAPNKVGVNLAGFYDTAYLRATARAVGEWGYVGVLTSPDQAFRLQQLLDDCASLHLIPLLRISVTGGQDDRWEKPQLRDALFWVNVFNTLNWHDLPRLLVVNNEVNLDQEWGGKANPAEYADWLSLFARTIRATASPPGAYKIMMSALTLGASDESGQTIHPATFVKGMKAAIPDIFNQVDGTAINIYTLRPYTDNRRWNYLGYREQLDLMGRDVPVYIMEEGLDPHFPYTDQDLADQVRIGWPTWQNDPLVVTVMPLAYVPGVYLPEDMRHSGGFWFFGLDGGGSVTAISRTYAALASIADDPNHQPPYSAQDELIRAFLPAYGPRLGGDVYFAEVRHNLDTRFVAAWQAGGGLAMFGYPLHEAVAQDGNLIQYTERARFELHPDGKGGASLQFGLLGREALLAQGRSFPPVAPLYQPTVTASPSPLATATPKGKVVQPAVATPSPTAVAAPLADFLYYPQTSHNISGPFLTYWRAQGGLATFGYPLSEPMLEGDLLVQYFERGRLELHANSSVTLGRLGYELARRLDLKGYW